MNGRDSEDDSFRTITDDVDDNRHSDPITNHQNVTKDDLNYPHACLCPREGCVLRTSCPFFHFAQQAWTR